MSKCIDKCNWKKTGLARYTNPIQEEFKCQSCGQKRWRRGKEIDTKTLEEGSPEWEEFRRRHLNGN